MSTIDAPPMRDNRTAAVSLAEQGFTILPCVPGGKAPIKDLSLGMEHGFHDASCDPGLTYSRWTARPTCNIGMVTGMINGIAVVDIDHDAGADEADYPVDWAKTKVVITPHGAHLYYLITGPQRSFKEVAGIGLKSDGGYVIAPPSFTDNRYELFRDRPLRPLPADWLDRFRPEEVERRQPPRVQRRLAEQRQQRRQGRYRHIHDMHAYVSAGLENEAGYVETAREGERNNQLYVAAFAMGQIVTTAWLSESLVTARLSTAARRAGLGDREISLTIRSGLAAGSFFPRSFD